MFKVIRTITRPNNTIPLVIDSNTQNLYSQLLNNLNALPPSTFSGINVINVDELTLRIEYLWASEQDRNDFTATNLQLVSDVIAGVNAWAAANGCSTVLSTETV